MLEPARIRLVIACLAAAGALAGCTTPHVKPKLSQAVIDARAHLDAPPEAACPQDALADISPLMVGFAFNESALGDTTQQPLTGPARWLACHPATPAVIKPDADSHGTDAEQDALAQARADGVKAYFVSQGVAAERITILRRGAADPTGAILLVRAEGRRW